MRDLPTLAEMLEAVPILKGWATGGHLKPTLQEVTAAYVVEGWLVAQGYSLIGGSASTASIAEADYAANLDAFVADIIAANQPLATRIGDGKLAERWKSILSTILVSLFATP